MASPVSPQKLTSPVLAAAGEDQLMTESRRIIDVLRAQNANGTLTVRVETLSPTSKDSISVSKNQIVIKSRENSSEEDNQLIHLVYSRAQEFLQLNQSGGNRIVRLSAGVGDKCFAKREFIDCGSGITPADQIDLPPDDAALQK